MEEARMLSVKIFAISETTPFSQDFRFRDQIRSAAGSVMDNIAEGFERSGRLGFINFLSISKGSTGEVRSQCYRALDQAYISKEQYDELHTGYEKLAAAISGFISYLNRSDIKGQKFKDRSK